MHVGLFDRDKHTADGGGHFHDAGARVLADNLPVNLAFRGYVDDDVALNLGLASQAPALRETAFLVVAFFNRIPVAERVLRHGHSVFWEISEGRRDLAFGTDAATAANAVEVDAQLPGGGQDRGADGEAAAFAGGSEDDKRVLGHLDLVPRDCPGKVAGMRPEESCIPPSFCSGPS